jgi:hypothetical protein
MVFFASEVGHKVELFRLYDRAPLTGGWGLHESEFFLTTLLMLLRRMVETVTVMIEMIWEDA